MSTTRIPTTVAECGCPCDPEFEEGHLGWHLPENHPEVFMFKPLRTPFGTVRQPTAEECRQVGRETSYSEPLEEGPWDDYRQLGDYVIERRGDKPETLEKLASLCEWLALGDEVYVLPGVGVYIEE